MQNISLLDRMLAFLGLMRRPSGLHHEALVDSYGELKPDWVVGRCYHMFDSGYGIMGDAVKCRKCGLDKYPEAVIHINKYIESGRVNDVQSF